MIKKFNWGHGLLLFIILFVGSMLYLVSLCFKEHFDLVSDDYYEKELVYQKQIERKKNTSSLESELTIQYNKMDKRIVIQLPSRFNNLSIPLDIVLYKPDNASLDKQLSITAIDSKATVDASLLKPGLWRMQVYWNGKDESYFNESNVYIQ